VPATVVPEPSPRDRAGSPLVDDGITLAFAEGASPDPAVARPADTAVPTQARPIPAEFAPSARAHKKSLFEVLFQRHQAREARETQVAALTPASNNQPITPTAASLSGDAHLPGVRPMHQLFGEDEADHEGEEAEGNYQVAAVGAYGRVAPNGLRLQTDKVDVGCLKPELVSILKRVEHHYRSKLIVTSGYRSPNRNRRAGGARKSLHMRCMAADIQVEGISKWDLAKYLRTVPGRGGVGTYCRTRSVHIDIGEIRDWHYPCRRLVKLKS
jgi:uncharacterized protein YcbK (DUF882 family)